MVVGQSASWKPAFQRGEAWVLSQNEYVSSGTTVLYPILESWALDRNVTQGFYGHKSCHGGEKYFPALSDQSFFEQSPPIVAAPNPELKHST